MSFPVVKLGDLCEMDRQGLDPDASTAAGLRFVGVENIGSQNGVLNFANCSRVGSQKSTTFRFDERHVLYAKLRPYLNKVATPDFCGRCSTELVPLLPREGVDREFVAHLLRQEQTVKHAMSSVTGSRMPRTDMKALMLLPVPLPPLEEQRRIVGILNRAAKIERLRKHAAQERLREFVPALFVSMFGDPATNPMGWDAAHLGDVCTIVGGGTPRRSNPSYFGGPVPWATPTDVTALTSLFISATRETITETALRESSARLVPARTVLLTSRATIGYTAVAATSMATNQGFINLICSDRLLPEYLANWLPLRRDYLVQLAGGTTFKEISKSALKQIRVPLPPIDMQRRFAAIAEAAQATVERMELAGRIAATLNASLMSRLLEDTA